MNVATFAADSIVSRERRMASWPSLTPDEFDVVQWKQFQHDETFHREISRLTVQQRLTHMALHFSKYVGYLAEVRDDEHRRKTVTDIFVIGVSTLTVLNVKAYPLVAAIDRKFDTSWDGLLREVATRAGRMASACERLDHLEDFPFRMTIRDAAAELVAIALAAAQDRGWNMLEMVEVRLHPVKKKSIFYDQLVR